VYHIPSPRRRCRARRYTCSRHARTSNASLIAARIQHLRGRGALSPILDWFWQVVYRNNPPLFRIRNECEVSCQRHTACNILQWHLHCNTHESEWLRHTHTMPRCFECFRLVWASWRRERCWIPPTTCNSDGLHNHHHHHDSTRWREWQRALTAIMAGPRRCLLQYSSAGLCSDKDSCGHAPRDSIQLYLSLSHTSPHYSHHCSRRENRQPHMGFHTLAGNIRT